MRLGSALFCSRYLGVSAQVSFLIQVDEDVQPVMRN